MKKQIRRSLSAICAILLTAGGVSALPTAVVQAAGTIVVNEICTKNTTVAAPDGQFYDFIELYNTGNAAVDAGGLCLSDDAANLRAYVLPAGTSIPAHGFLTVWCDVPEGTAGAPFGLSKKGETVYLSDAQGNLLESHEIPALADDTSYGRVPDGSETLAVLSQITPGSANNAGSAGEIVVRTPEFSQESGFYASEFQLSLTAPAGCTVYYTLDGSDPTTASTAYSAPIRVYDRSPEANVYAAETDIGDNYRPPADPVDKAMIVRAVAVDASGNVSSIATKTYFIGYTNADFITNMRVISLVTDPDNLFDYEKGIYVRGKTYDEWRKSPDYNPMAQSWTIPTNWTQSGKEWERPAHITVFENGQATYNAGVGIRIHGGATRSSAQKSFNLYARADYGTSKIEYDFFNGALTDVNGKQIKKFDKITLRNGGNDNTTKIRDRLNQELLEGRFFGTQAQDMCVVFLDGEFWGTYNIVEKLGKEYISDHYDVKEKDVCMIKTNELSDGSDKGLADYEALCQFALSDDFASEESVRKLSEMVDLRSFADYMAAEVILGNWDFGNNNFALWKTETVDETRPYADGKWRFLLFDTEYGQGLYGSTNANYNLIQRLQEQANGREPQWLPSLFLKLMKTDNEFSRMYIQCVYDQLNVCYTKERATARLQELQQLYQPSMPATIDRFGMGSGMGWGFPGFGGQQGNSGEQTFRNEVNTISQFWSSRTENMQRQTMQWVSDMTGNQLITVNVRSDAPVLFNSLAVNGSFSGTYPNRMIFGVASLPDGASVTGVTCEQAEITANGSAFTIAPNMDIRQMAIDISTGGTPVPTGYTAADVQLLLQYLLRLENLTAAQASRYDMDSSGKLDARDLALLKAAILK